MSSATRFIFFGAISFLLIVGCDRTVQPIASQSDNEGKQQSAKVPDDTSLVDHSPAMAQADKGDSGQDVLPSVPQSSPDSRNEEERSFTLEITKSDDPNIMLQQLGRIDRSIEQLLLAQQQMKPESVRENGIKLSKLKLAAAQHLKGLTQATPEHMKAGTKAQLVALSHLSGLKDVQAARQLEALGKELLDSPDGELKQQGQIVLYGFAVQSLQNGIITDPQQIVDASKALVADERYRGRVEMTSLQHGVNVLAQLGYRDSISQIQRIAFDAFSSSTDQPLRHEAWNRLVANSPAQLEFMSALEPLGTSAFESRSALNAAKKLINEFPNPVTLEMLAATVSNIEYAGQVEFSKELSQLISLESANYPVGISSTTIQAYLNEHKLRMNWLGHPFEMLEIVDTDGKPLEIASLAGKVVLVSFGLTWDLNCMKELTFIQRAYDELHEDGLEVLFISMDSDLQQLQKFVKDNAKPWKTYRSATGDPRELTQYFGITMFPHMMLVGRDGKVARLHVRGQQITEQAKLLLSK